MIQLNPTLCDETNRIQMTLLHFGHACLGNWWNGEEDFLSCSQLYYIVKGSAKVLCNGKTLLTMEEGNWYLIPTGTSVTYWCEDFMEEIYFHFKLCNINRIDLLQGCPSPYQLPIQKDMTSLFLACLSSHDVIDGIRLRQIVYSVLLNFIDEYNISLNKRELSPCVLKAITYIGNHLSMRLTMSDIVNMAYVSKSTLEKYFKKELGVSVYQYLLDTVLFEAGQLLLKTSLSIRDISELFGFYDQFYFSKRFKEKFGKSPKEFRHAAPM